MAVPYQDLAQETNQFMTGQALAPYLANLPNYASMVGSRTNNISQQLKGQLPQDVINQIQQQAAERGIATGTSGAPNNNAAYLRALGLNSLQMQQQGNQNLTGAIADTPVPQLFNPMSLNVPMTLARSGLAAASSGRQDGAGGRVNQLSGTPNFPSYTTIDRSAGYPNIPVLYGSGTTTGLIGGPQYGDWKPPVDNSIGIDFSTPEFDPTSYLTAYDESNGSGGSVDWSGLYNDPNLPAGWADQTWGGAFNQIDASNPDNAFMFE